MGFRLKNSFAKKKEKDWCIEFVIVRYLELSCSFTSNDCHYFYHLLKLVVFVIIMFGIHVQFIAHNQVFICQSCFPHF